MDCFVYQNDCFVRWHFANDENVVHSVDIASYISNSALIRLSLYNSNERELWCFSFFFFFFTFFPPVHSYMYCYAHAFDFGSSFPLGFLLWGTRDRIFGPNMCRCVSVCLCVCVHAMRKKTEVILYFDLFRL